MDNKNVEARAQKKLSNNVVESLDLGSLAIIVERSEERIRSSAIGDSVMCRSKQSKMTLQQGLPSLEEETKYSNSPVSLLRAVEINSYKETRAAKATKTEPQLCERRASSSSEEDVLTENLELEEVSTPKDVKFERLN